MKRETVQRRMAKEIVQAKKNLGLTDEDIRGIIETENQGSLLAKLKKQDDKAEYDKLDEWFEFQQWGAVGQLTTNGVKSLFQTAEQEIGFTSEQTAKVLKGAGISIADTLKQLTASQNIDRIQTLQNDVGLTTDDIVSVLQGEPEKVSKTLGLLSEKLIPAPTPEPESELREQIKYDTAKIQHNLGLTNKEIQSIVETDSDILFRKLIEGTIKSDDVEKDLAENSYALRYAGALHVLATNEVKQLFESAEKLGFTSQQTAKILKGSGLQSDNALNELLSRNNVRAVIKLEQESTATKGYIASALEGRSDNITETLNSLSEKIFQSATEKALENKVDSFVDRLRAEKPDEDEPEQTREKKSGKPVKKSFVDRSKTNIEH